MFDGLADGVFKSEDAGTCSFTMAAVLSVDVRGEITSFEDSPADRGPKSAFTKMSRNEGFASSLIPSHSRKLFYKIR
jgi:hypothetical protein